MAEKKQKFYVVWVGRVPGIYVNWTDCKSQIDEFPNAKYKSFESLEKAEEAYVSGYANYIASGKTQSFSDLLKQCVDNIPVGKPSIGTEALAVDAACSHNPGVMEYRGVYLKDNSQIFHAGPFQLGTNNIGEFLAIVHGLALLKQRGSEMPIYSDSANAISWIRQKKCKTNLVKNNKTEQLYNLIERAENWLKNNDYHNPIRKWQTESWGEIPADFGRKK